MKIKFIALLATGLIATTASLPAAEPGAAATEMRAVITKIQTKVKEGKKTEADLADELKDLSALVEKYRADQSDDAAQILMMQASLYAQVLGNEAKGKELRARVQKEFPDSKVAAMMKRQEEAEKVRAGLTVGTVFPDFNEKDTAGKPLSIANYKGKVVLIDFWATWCGPCVKELPNVLAAYEKHHAAGFEIIGISLDSDAQKLEKFVKEKNMPWSQFFDGNGWGNKLAQQYGVNSIPATYLLDREGKIIGKGLRGEKLEEAVAAALAKK
ncbi:MAG: TlpA disulfide reductase family protein [Verrucomicrobiota bacterium]